MGHSLPYSIKLLWLAQYMLIIALYVDTNNLYRLALLHGPIIVAAKSHSKQSNKKD